VDSNCTGRASQATRVSRKRSRPNCGTDVKVGVKRKSDLTLDALELGCKLAEHELSDFQLRVKSSGQARSFSMVSEDSLMKHLDQRAAVSRFDMNKLEIEYDYDTESE